MNHVQSSAITWNLWEDRVAFLIAALGVALAASVFYSPLPLLLVLAIPSCYYFISRPYELLLVMVFLIPFNFVFKIGPLPVAFEVVKVLAWIPFLLTLKERPGFISSRYNKWFGVWAGIIVLSLARSSDLPFTIKECVRLGSNIALCYLVVNLVDSREKVVQVLRVLAISTLVVACYGFYQFAIQDYGALFWIINPRLDTNLAHYRDTFWPWRNRIISVLTSEMELGHYFNMSLPIGVVLWLVEGRRRINSKWLFIALAMLAGLLLTFTFGAWLALVATMGIFVLILDRRRRWALVTGSLAVCCCSTLLILGPLRPLVESKVSGVQIGSFAWDVLSRLKAWTFAFGTWQSHPLLGVGIGNYENLSAESDWIGVGPIGAGSTPHETYLYLLAESGIVGLFGIMTILFGSIRSNLSLKRNPQLGLIGIGLAFSILVNMIGGFSDDSPFVGPHTSYVLWLFVGLSEVLRNIAAKRATSDDGMAVGP
jgi:O-antigen ligase